MKNGLAMEQLLGYERLSKTKQSSPTSDSFSILN